MVALLLALLMLLAPLTAAFFLARLTCPRNRVEAMVTFTTALSTCIILLAYILSLFSRLDNLGWWAGGGTLILLLALAPAVTTAGRVRLFSPLSLPYEVDRRVRGADWRRFDTWLLLLVASAVSIVSAINFFLILSFEPATPDAHAYHLPRMLYFLQHGNLNYFPTDYWNIIAYPKIASILHLFSYLASGEVASLTQLVQFLAYFATMVAIYGICRELGAPRRGSLFAALTFGLMIICIMEGATAQNDLILTVFIACATYYLVAYRATRKVHYLLFATVPLAMALGVKATVVLALPALLLITIFALWPKREDSGGQWVRHLGLALGALVVALLLFTAPSGYVDNWRAFHNPFGPTALLKRYIPEGQSHSSMLSATEYNFLRYSAEFLEPDGYPPLPWCEQIEQAIMYFPKTDFEALHINLQKDIGARFGYHFRYVRATAAGENTSSWGFVGPLLVLPVAFLVLLGLIKSSPGTRIFVIAAILYHIAAAALMLYDQFHGRFYTTAAIFALPPLAFISLQPRPIIGRVYLSLAVVIVCIVGVNAAIFRVGSPLFKMTYRSRTVSSVFGYGRTGELVREAPTYLPMNIDLDIPENATVGLDVTTPFPEYFIFGEHHLRTIVPLCPFWQKHLPPPPGVKYLIYDSRSPLYHKGDMAITEPTYPFGVFYLRKPK